MGRGYLIAGDGVGQGGQKTAEEGCCSLEGNERSDRVEVEWVRGVGVLKVKDRNLVI